MGKKEKQKNPTVLMLVVGKNKHLFKIKKNNKQVDHAKSKAGTDLELGPSHGHVDPVGV